MSRSCPPNSFVFNSTRCHCNPGYLLGPSRNSCALFQISQSEWSLSSGVDHRPIFFENLFSFDTIRRFTQSQAIFLETTFIALLSWLLFCAAVRFRHLGDGQTVWFRIRWWISRLDCFFSTRHWLEDQKVVKKRKTELGGTFSIASLILFIGLFSALLYQILSKRNIEVHNVKPANAPDLLSFVNDIEFNITSVSSMTCSHLRGLGTLVIGNIGSINYKTSPLTIFANYSCQNTSLGPTITLKCNSCQVPRDNFYVSWYFVDLPNDPVSAVGFLFNLTSKRHGDDRHVSFVSGKLKSGSFWNDRPHTFRGPDVNILKFHLFPRIYRNLKNLSLIQPLFYEFVPGSSIYETNKLQASLQSVEDGLINATVHVNFISDYIIEINHESILGPVTFLADLGGIYTASFLIFFFCLVQCERVFKNLRDEDTVLRNIRNKTRAQFHWDLLRKYVHYTWGRSQLEEKNDNTTNKYSLGSMESFCGIGSLQKRKRRSGSISFNEKNNVGIEMVPDDRLFNLEKAEHKTDFCSCKQDISQPQVLCDIDMHPPAPVPEISTEGTSDAADIHKNLQSLYDYNVYLRGRLMNLQSLLDNLIQKESHAECSAEPCRGRV